jgi:hypothetical protein
MRGPAARAALVPLVVAAALLATSVGVPLSTAAPTTAVSQAVAAWPPRTIVKVTGTKDEGFVVRRLDGSVSFPPTWSEAMAECAELSTAIQRARCTTFVRVRYADLLAIKRAIRYARAQA